MSVEENAIAEALNDAIVEMGDGTEVQEEQVEEPTQELEAVAEEVPADELEAPSDSGEAEAPPSALPEGLEWASDFDIQDDDTVAAINFWAGGADDKRFHMTVPEMRQQHGDEFAEKYKAVQSAYSKHENAKKRDNGGVPDDWVQRKLQEYYLKDQMPQTQSAPAPAVPAEPVSVVDNAALEQMKAAVESGDGESAARLIASIVGDAVNAVRTEAKAEALNAVQTQTQTQLNAEIKRRDAILVEEEGQRYAQYRQNDPKYGGQCAVQWVMDNMPINPFNGQQIVYPEDAYQFLLQGERHDGAPVITRPSVSAQPPAASSDGVVPEVTEEVRNMSWEDRIRMEFRNANIR